MSATDPLDFFSRLRWLDRRPLLDTIEPYRRAIFTGALATFGPDGWPLYNRVLCGRAKKNFKTADLTLAALYRFLAWPSASGNDCFIIANDEEQAGDDLSLAKKLIAVNPELKAEVKVLQKEIVRKDGAGRMQILPAQDVAGLHGKTYLFLGFDEIHGYRNYDLFEALSPDPTRLDALVWITSYAGTRHAPGIPLFDLMQAGKTGTDPGMFFSWVRRRLYHRSGTLPARTSHRSGARTRAWRAGGTLAISMTRSAACPSTSIGACISICPALRMALPLTPRR